MMKEIQDQEHSEEERSINLSREDIDFFKGFVGSEGVKKPLAVARFLAFPHTNVAETEISKARERQARLSKEDKARCNQQPELGAFEYRTASIIAREFSKALEPAIEGGIVNGEVIINVIDKGDHKLLSPYEYRARLKNGTEGLRIVGVIASIDGDDKEGPNILLRNDMDALQMADGSVIHQCGHNVHSAWAVMNFEAMLKYKKKFGLLPFNRVLFVSEANEEGNPAAGDQVSPQEMIKSGFLERYGEMNFVLGAHVVASIPEGTVRLTEAGFHGATDFVIEAKPTDLFKEDDTDPRLIPLEMAHLINKQYSADEPHNNLGKLQLVHDNGEIMPSRYVRLVEVKEAKIEKDGRVSYDNLAINSMSEESEYTGKISNGNLTFEDLNLIAETTLKRWREHGFDIRSKASVENSIVHVSVGTGGFMHVAFGSPNPRQILGEIMSHVIERVRLASTTPVEGLKFGGTVRIREHNDEEVKKEISEDLKRILEESIHNLGLQGKVKADFYTQNSVGAIMNHPELVKEASRLCEKIGVINSDIGLPNAAAESFAEYKSFLKSGDKDKMLYFQVGGMDQKTANRLLESGESVSTSSLQHSKDFEVKSSVIPMGILLDMFAIQFARSWKNKKR